MQLEQFIAESAVDAVARIRAKLGTDAVVVNVRQLPRHLWQRPRIEVLAHGANPEKCETPTEPVGMPCGTPPPADERSGEWRVWTVLERLGFLPLHAQRVVEELRATYGDTPPG